MGKDDAARLCAGSIALAAAVLCAHPAPAAAGDPQRVTFPSADGRTMLVGYVFRPERMPAPRVPGVVMMHGRAGAYSSRAGGRYDASTLSRRHRAWGQRWAQAGYVAVLVDGFGPRGYVQGFPRFSYHRRPAEVDEVTVRPLDAYGALAYLRSRADVLADRIGLHGWSNGASAALSTMAVDPPGMRRPTRATGFRAALAFYPACGLKNRLAGGYLPYAPVLVLHGLDDEEVSARRCRRLVESSRAAGGDIAIHLYEGATHGFDDPGRRRQGVAGNAAALKDAIRRAQAFFARELAGR
jgi:carboxymethylenebutenolidase